MEATPHAPEGLVQGRYRLGAVLGTGGMGSVHEALDERLGRPVALKLVHDADPTSAARLRAEASVLARLDHPNLVGVYDVGEHEGRSFVVTELVRGRTLRRRMDEGPMAPDDVARLGAQIASALACAHDHGVVHRDVTPGNVLLTDGSGTARLIDFGIAVSRDALALTATGQVIGTPAYLSPEQVEGTAATTASDVYSLGLVLLEALTGHRAFPGTPTESAATRLVGDAPVPADLPAGWGALLTSMTARDRDQRPGSSEVADRLGSLTGPSVPDGARDTTVVAAVPVNPTIEMAAMAGSTMVAAAPVASSTRRRRWPVAVAGVALLAGLLVLAAVGLRDPGDPTPASDPAAGAAETTTVPDSAVAPLPVATVPTTAAPVTATTVAPVTTVAPTTTPTSAGPPERPTPGGGAGKTPPAPDDGRDKGKGRGD